MGRGGRKSQGQAAGQRGSSQAQSALVEEARRVVADSNVEGSRIIEPDETLDYRAKILDYFDNNDRPDPVCVIHSEELIDVEMGQSMAQQIDMYHVITGDFMNKRAFENGLVSSALRSGHSAREAKSKTNPGTDVFFDDLTLSLKTESRKDISEDRMVISKLMQSINLRDKIKSKEDAVKFIPEILDHLGRYNKIIMLRAFCEDMDQEHERVRYEMLEVPKRMLIRGLKGLEPGDFSDVTKNGSTSAKIRNSRGDIIFTLALDGSAGKVTLREVATKKCKPHASWVSQKRKDL